MAVFKNERFLDHRVTEPFQLDISAEGEPEKLVTFKDPNKMPARKAFEIQEQAETNPKAYLEELLGADFAAFWAVWGDYPTDALANLTKEVGDHFRR